MSCTDSVCGTGRWTGPLPGDPDNNSILTAIAEFGGIRLRWTMPNTNAYAVAHTWVYRSIGDDFETAIPLDSVSATTYFDTDAAVVIRQYYYWIQHTSINGTILDPIGPVFATAMPEIDKVLAALAGRIESSALAQSLMDRINVITDLENGVTQLSTQLVTENALLTQELNAIHNELTDASAYIDSQQQILLNANQALTTSVNTQLSQLEDGVYAALEEESITRADQTGELFAQYTIKTDLAGHVSGFGLAASVDPEGNYTSDFQVRADTFSIAPPTINQATAPSNPYHGMIWVDTSTTPGVAKWYNSALSQWQTTPIQGAVPFIVKTAPEVVDGYTIPPGVYIDSAVISRIAANQIDTRGLTIKDEAGNVIFGAGTGLDWSEISGATKPQDGATRNVHRGLWAVSTVYLAGDTVLDASGYGWICTATNTSSGANQPPTYPTTSNAYWSLYIVRGADGADGIGGTRTAVLDMYKWSADTPTTFPSGTSTFTWSSGQFTTPTTPNGWEVIPPAVVPGQTLWSVRQTYGDSLSDATSVITWSATTARPLGRAGTDGTNGSDGLNGTRTAFLELYKWSATAPTTFPSGNSSYTWATGAFTAPGVLNGWALLPGAAVAGQTLWACSVSFADALTTPTSLIPWSTSTAYAVGAAGTNGVNTINMVLSNEAHTVPADSAGTVSSFSGAACTVTIYNGTADDTANWTITQALTAVTVTASGPPANRTATVTAMSADVGYVDFTASRSGYASITGRFTVTKSKAGATGLQGIQGPAGSNGVTYYTWVKYADSPTTGMSDFPAGKLYMGIAYNKTTAVESTNYADYDWALIKGDQGIQGPAGNDGQPTYTWIKYADNASGLNMSDSPTDKLYIGIAVNKTTAVESTTAADYTWALIQGPQGATGATGPQGPSVVVTTNRPATFTATDGTLDAAQTDIIFSAEVSGVTGPTYVWSFSGFQTAPTNSGTSTQTITAAQFGTSKSAIVTCTVSGAYTDKVTVIRLEKSTAAAGATVGATIGTNLSGQFNSGNISTYMANAAIGTAQIQDASVTAAKIGSIALVGVGNFSVKSSAAGARMEMDSRAIKVYDASGVLRVQIGDLSA